MQNNNKHLRNKKILLIIILLSVQLMSSCADNKYTSFTNSMDHSDTSYLPVTNAAVHYGLSDKEGNTVDEGIFYIDVNESFEKFISIGNFVDHDSEYKILTFVNYRQSEFYVDDKKCSDFTVKIKEQNDLHIPIKLSGLEEGFNDIIFAIVTYPNTFLTDTDRELTEMNHMLFIRFHVIVDEFVEKRFELTDFDTTQEEPIPEIFIHDKRDILKRITSINIKEKLELFLTAGNIYDEEKDFAVIFLKDFKQIAIYKDQEVIYTNLKPQEKFTMPIELEFSGKGNHEINAILVEAPFEKYSPDNSVANSIRIGVIKE